MQGHHLNLALFILCAAGPWIASAGEPAAAFPPFVWKSEPHADCPFERSKEITGIEFLGVHSDYRFADTWYPSWAADGNLYSPWTDGPCHNDSSNSDGYEPVGTDAMETFKASGTLQDTIGIFGRSRRVSC